MNEAGKPELHADLDRAGGKFLVIIRYWRIDCFHGCEVTELSIRADKRVIFENIKGVNAIVRYARNADAVTGFFVYRVLLVLVSPADQAGFVGFEPVHNIAHGCYSFSF